MDDKRLPDTPWHVGFVKKEEDDPRRHKARCVYYVKGICHQGKMGCYLRKCPGSSHCQYYAESEVMAKEVYLKTRTVEEERADYRQEYLFSGRVRIEKEQKAQKHIKRKDSASSKVNGPFWGIEYLPIREIVVTEKYKQWQPNPDELNSLMTFYEDYKKMDKPILVQFKDGRYILVGNFLQYHVSVKLRKKWIKATMDATYLNRKRK